jgi:hypothetical protein
MQLAIVLKALVGAEETQRMMGRGDQGCETGGLELISKKGLGDIVVVDHVARVPIGN